MTMNEKEFQEWKSKLQSLDPYGSEVDCNDFFKLLDGVKGSLGGDVISVLLGTFTNADDYGVQERVLVTLDDSDPLEFASQLSKGFKDLLARSSEKEWPLIIIGRIFNSEDPSWIRPLADAARANSVLRSYLLGDEFLGEYPEAKALLIKFGV